MASLHGEPSCPRGCICLPIPTPITTSTLPCAHVKEIEAIKARVKEMEEEAEKLKEMQGEVEKQMMSAKTSMSVPLNVVSNLFSCVL